MGKSAARANLNQTLETVARESPRRTEERNQQQLQSVSTPQHDGRWIAWARFAANKKLLGA